MKKLNLLMLLVFPVLLAAQAHGNELKIREVTVYLQGAEVKSDADISLKRGLNEVEFKGLSPHIDPNTIQIAGAGFTVMSVTRTAEVNEDNKSYNDSLKICQGEIAGLEKSLRAEKSLLSVLGKEEQLLVSNQKIAGEGNIIAADLRSNLEYFFRRFGEIEKQRLDISENINLLNLQLDEAKERMKSLKEPDKKISATVTFMLQSEQTRVVPVEVRYWVNQCSWFPSYDIFAQNGKVEISYKSNVIQQTGSSWKDVQLTVSSASPGKGQSPPQLRPNFLSFASRGVTVSYGGDAELASSLGIYNVQGQVLDSSDGSPLPGVTILVKGTTVGTVTNMNGEFNLQLPSLARSLVFSFIGMSTIEMPITSGTLNVFMESDVVGLEEVIVVGYGTARGTTSGSGVRQREAAPPPRPKAPPSVQVGYQTSFAYKVDVPYSVPSAEIPTQVEINRVSIPGIMRYVAVPRLETAAFLTARIPNWQQYNLLDGEANLYLDNQYMGRNVLETRTFEDTLSLSMGRDENVIIERVRQRDYEQRRLFSSRIKEERVWQTAVRNNKSEKIIIEIIDNVPMSQSSDIKVDVIDVSGASHNTDTGMLNWVMEIEPGQTVQLLVHYSVEYPRGRNVFID